MVRARPPRSRLTASRRQYSTRYLVGLTDRENRQILDLLFDQIARPEFTVRFRWETDSVAFWDNRSTAHLGPVDLASSE